MLRCPFCVGEMEEQALVCPTCNRDVAIPALLRAEHEDLLRKRDQLRAELAQAAAKLASRTRKVTVGNASAD